MLDLFTNFKTIFIKRDLPANSWWIDVRTRHVIAFCHPPRISSHHQQRPTLGYIGVQVRKTFYNSQTKSAQLRFFGPKSHLYLILVSLAESSETCLMKPWCVTIVRPLWHKLISNHSSSTTSIEEHEDKMRKVIPIDKDFLQMEDNCLPAWLKVWEWYFVIYDIW